MLKKRIKQSQVGMNYPPFLFSKWISMCWWVGVVGWDEKERKQYKYDVVVVLLMLLPCVELARFRSFLFCVCVQYDIYRGENNI
mmetsp:Transcript_53386/g.57986  ORF Transcript_53386/g.57986 Transcript_53386/m.57986 type:complete len:84 (-) Transcript_53386:146-397(-)